MCWRTGADVAAGDRYRIKLYTLHIKLFNKLYTLHIKLYTPLFFL